MSDIKSLEDVCREMLPEGKTFVRVISVDINIKKANPFFIGIEFIWKRKDDTTPYADFFHAPPEVNGGMVCDWILRNAK